MRNIRLPLHRISLLPLFWGTIVYLMAINNIVVAQSIQIDTVLIEACDVLFEGEPESFTLSSLDHNGQFLLRSDYYRGVVLDSNFQTIHFDPITTRAKAGFCPYIAAKMGCTDQIYVSLDKGDAHLFQIQNANIPKHCSGLDGSTSKIKNAIDISSSVRSIPPTVIHINQIEPNKWIFHTAVQVRSLTKKPIHQKEIPAFLTYELSLQGSKWRSRMVKTESNLRPISEPAKMSSMLYGFSDIAPCREGIWWTDYFSHYVYLYSSAGHLMDSVKIEHQGVSSQSYCKVDDSKSSKANVDNALAHSNFYYGLRVSEAFMVRFVNVGDESRQYMLVYKRDTKQRVDIALPSGMHITGLKGSTIFCTGTRAENKIAIPTFDLNQFFRN